MLPKFNGREYFIKVLFIINFVYTLHFSLAIYINSSYLNDLFGVNYTIGFPYVIAAVFAIYLLSLSEKILIKFGIFKTAIVLLLIDIISLLVLFFSGLDIFILPTWFTLIFFIIYYTSAIFLFRFILDVYLEEDSKRDNTGILRGEFLAIASVAWFISPFVTGILLSNGDFWKIYGVALLLAIILLILSILYLRKIPDPLYEKIYFFKSLKQVFKNKNLKDIFVINFLMYFYFSWMVIYMPIYLHETLNISWKDIGLFIFPAMLLPYVLIDIPFGYLADKFGEKKFIFIGLTITTLATIPIMFIESSLVFIWAILLFGTRVGTSIIELMTDTYFFKKIDAKDSNLISIYRNSQPLAYIIGPLSASIILYSINIPIQYLFLILSIITFSGIFFALKIKDTK